MSTTTEQLALFDTGLNLTETRSEMEDLMQKERSKNTLKAYAYSWSVFARWCESKAGRQPLPASPDTVALFVTWAIKKKGYRLDTVRLCLAAIAERHKSLNQPSPLTPEIRTLVSNASREQAESDSHPPSRAKQALRPPQITTIARSMGNDVLGVRDRALMCVGFFCGLRGSEIMALHLCDISFDEQSGDLVIKLRRLKTDQKGKGRLVRVQRGKSALTCPVRQLKRWLSVRGDWPGPLFCSAKRYTVQRRGVQGRVLCHAVHRGLRKIGVNPAAYGAHSLRSGFVTASAENGASELAIRARTGHKSIGMLARYVHDIQGLRVNPLKGVL